jgi:hypothetical protein
MSEENIKELVSKYAGTGRDLCIGIYPEKHTIKAGEILYTDTNLVGDNGAIGVFMA